MKIILNLLAILCGIIAIVGGFLCGISIFAYSIYLIVMLCKGVAAVTFLKILWIVVLWVGAGLAGWIWGLVWLAIAAMFKAIAD